MRWRAVLTIFGKELAETIRDRRTLFALIVLPVLMQPLLMLAGGQVVASVQASRAGIQPRLAVWGPLPEAARKALLDKLQPTFEENRAEIPPNPDAEARTLIAGGKVDLILAVPAGAATLFSGDGKADIDLYFDSVGERSGAAYDRVGAVLDGVQNDELKIRLARRELPADFDKPLHYSLKDLASKENKGGDFAGRVLPMILLLWCS